MAGRRKRKICPNPDICDGRPADFPRRNFMSATTNSLKICDDHPSIQIFSFQVACVPDFLEFLAGRIETIFQRGPLAPSESPGAAKNIQVLPSNRSPRQRFSLLFNQRMGITHPWHLPHDAKTARRHAPKSVGQVAVGFGHEAVTL
jgi:hypothetical protein